ncbi:VWA domain-containing protein [Marinobacter sp.]|uniref:VWA domain-containing protein n=1 Tax=Marinobacter sp. TaxID=50741 RepID=UPI0035C6C59D
MKSSGFIALFALLLAMSLSGLVTAQEATGEVRFPEKSDVRIIVDISGSMKETDPENLRQPAVRLLARLLPEGSTAGVWTFGQYVNMLVPHQEVTDAWRDMAIQRSAQINSVALRTNLGAAIQTASDDYVTDGDLSRTHFILLTDGKVDISDKPEANAAEEQRILDSIAARLIDRGATFHPVALSEAADTDFLKALASRSGGRFQVAQTADALNLAFLEALNTAVPQEQIPIEGDGFTVDSGVQEFTALIFWGESETAATRELTLVRPDGQALSLNDVPDNVRWAREAGYDLITVTGPQAGKWGIQGELGEGSRVTVVSDLRMVVSPMPPTFSAETPLDVRVAFFEEQEKITNPDFLGVLEVTLSITSEDGRSGTKILSGEQPPEDGTYRDTVGSLPAPGLYTIDVVADGQTFSRKFSATVGFTVPEGAEATTPTEAMGEPLAEPESEEGAVLPEAEPSGTAPQAEAEPAAEPAIESPIDVSQVESAPATAEEAPVAPEAVAPEEQAQTPSVAGPDEAEPASGLPVWVYGAAGGAVAMLAGIVWFALRQRRKRQEAQAQAAAERETLADLDEEPEAEPTAEAIPEPEPEPEPELESEPELEPEPEDIPEVTEPPTEDEFADLEAEIDESEPPKVEEEWPAEADDLADEDVEIPVADTPVDEEPAGDDDEEEFGLEDFDLSEFDDLPDYDEEQSGLPDDDSDEKRNQKDSKK